VELPVMVMAIAAAAAARNMDFLCFGFGSVFVGKGLERIAVEIVDMGWVRFAVDTAGMDCLVTVAAETVGMGLVKPAVGIVYMGLERSAAAAVAVSKGSVKFVIKRRLGLFAPGKDLKLQSPVGKDSAMPTAIVTASGSRKGCNFAWSVAYCMGY
jgi:hypothetical protein